MTTAGLTNDNRARCLARAGRTNPVYGERVLKMMAGFTIWVISLATGLGQADALDRWTTNLYNAWDRPVVSDVAYGNGLYVAVGGMGREYSSVGYVLTSDDGQDWTIRASDKSYAMMHGLHSVIFANGIFVAVGDHACIYLSLIHI